MNSVVLHSGIVLYYALAWIGLLPLIRKPSNDSTEDQRLTTMRDIGNRYLTMWNFTLQTVIFIGYLVCDVLEIQQKFVSSCKRFRHFLDQIFYSIIAPVTILVSLLFWVLYSYDPGLVYIYPNLIGEILSHWANHTMHTIILFTLFLQVYHNRSVPVKLPQTQFRLMVLSVIYVICLYGTFFQKKVWVYPFLNHLTEPLRFLSLVALAIILHAINIAFYRINESLCCYTTERIEKQSNYKRN